MPHWLHWMDGIQTNAQKIQSIADAFTDDGCVLSNSSRKDQHVQAPKNCGIRANVFLRSVAEQIHSFLGSSILLHLVHQNPHIRGRLRNSQQSRFLIHQCIHFFRGYLFLLKKIQQDARIDIAGTGTHNQSFERGEAHRRVDAFPRL